jgi:O-antigen/teichoic acid export membrane protein
VAGPVFFEKAGLGKSRRRLDQARDGIRRLTVISCSITLAVCAVLAVLGGLIMDILVSHEYRAGAAYLPWLALAGGLFSAGQIYSLEFLANFKTALLARIKILTAVAGVGLNFAGAFWFGIPGVIGAAILFSAMYFAWIIRLSVRGRHPHG